MAKAAKGSTTKAKSKHIFKKIIFWTFGLFFGSTLFFVLFYRWVNPPFTPLMGIRIVQQIKKGEEIKCNKDWVRIDDISPNMVRAVVAAEDNLFLSHNGFDWNGLKKAAAYNEKHKGKKIHGGSTISQQTAKNVFLWPARSYIRKGLEVYFTCLIEVCWPKERIMEVYLNVIETGRGVYGVEAAAQKYYGRSADRLNMSQAAMIAAILPSPQKRNPSNPSSYLNRRQAKILNIMGKIGRVEF